MTTQTTLGGSFTLANATLTVNRMGYGAMKLTGPELWGPPKDEPAAIALLREAVASGVNHIDTSDFYGPHVQQPPDQTGAASVSENSGDRHQSRCAPRPR